MSAGRSTNHESRKRKKTKREQVKMVEARKRRYFYQLKKAWRNYWAGGIHPKEKAK